MKRILFCSGLTSVLLFLSACSSGPESKVATEEEINPFTGTWKLNVEKSTFNPPESALKSDLVLVEPIENGLKFTFDRVDYEGKNIHIEESPKFDGQPYPVTGEGSAEMVALKRLGPNSFGQVITQDGAEINDVTVVIADDGKSSTVTSKTKDANGQELTTTTYYDKQ